MNVVTINGILIPYTDDPETNAEILLLKKLAKREEGHG
jgi:hypothetical protein